MSILVLIYVIAERLLELVIAHGNTRRLLARGAREAGAAHYPFMVALHAGWLAAIVAWVMLTPASYSPAFLVLYGLLQVLRIWVMVSLGPYWTTRIITLADTPLVKHGPYKYFRHPNYVVVVLEVVTLPLVFGAWHIAVIFSVLNAGMLWVRIRAENHALSARGPAAS